jgi:LmbE family N-acetylglucosaminyl deacetylase
MMAQGQRPAAVTMDGVPFPMIGYDESEITTVINIIDYLDTKLRALRCHATQVDASADDDQTEHMLASPWAQQEAFMLARSTVGWTDELEADLFRGLR